MQPCGSVLYNTSIVDMMLTQGPITHRYSLSSAFRQDYYIVYKYRITNTESSKHQITSDLSHLGADHLISGGGGGVEENVPEQSIYFSRFGNKYFILP